MTETHNPTDCAIGYTCDLHSEVPQTREEKLAATSAMYDTSKIIEERDAREADAKRFDLAGTARMKPEREPLPGYIESLGYTRQAIERRLAEFEAWVGLVVDKLSETE